MAAFRAITAEEEAASGLMRCLQALRYGGADRLNPHDHVSKHAVYPFIDVLRLFFADCKDTIPEARMRLLDRGHGEQLVIELVLPNGLSAVSEMPLHFSVKEGATGIWASFAPQVRRFEVANKISSIKLFLRSEANRRNLLLYASPKGVPDVVLDGDLFILDRQKRVFVLLCAYLMIYPYAEHQLFVSHALTQFLEVLAGVKT